MLRDALTHLLIINEIQTQNPRKLLHTQTDGVQFVFFSL